MPPTHRCAGCSSQVALCLMINAFLATSEASDDHQQNPVSPQSNFENRDDDRSLMLIELTAERLHEHFRQLATAKSTDERQLYLKEYKQTLCLSFEAADRISGDHSTLSEKCQKSNFEPKPVAKPSPRERRTDYWSMR